MLPLCMGVYHCVYVWSIIMCLYIHAKRSARVLSFGSVCSQVCESVYLLKGG